MLLTGPSTIFATASALFSPCATSTSVVASEDGAETLGEAVGRHLVGGVEEPGVVGPGLRGQGLDPGPRGERGRRLVEADVPVGADPEDLQVDRTGLGDPRARTPRRPRPRRRPARRERARARGRARAVRRLRAGSPTGSSPGGRRAGRRTRRGRRRGPPSSRALPRRPGGPVRRRWPAATSRWPGRGRCRARRRIRWPILAAASRPTSAGVSTMTTCMCLPPGTLADVRGRR